MNEKFLDGIGFRFDADYCTTVTEGFEAEIAARMEGRPSSLRMIPSGFAVSGELVRDRAVVIDAGGTNLRVAVVKIAFDGSAPAFSRMTKIPMPGTRGALTADEFHWAIATPVNAALADEPALDALGYCFSYECRTLPGGDAELVAWSKQVAAPEVVGQAVGAELVRRLMRPVRPPRVLNDTVATLLAGRAMAGAVGYSGYVGFILGTGTNVASVENGVICNAESGEFNKIARSSADLALDRMTGDPGCAVFEKMVSGAYLGNLGLCLWRAAAQGGLLDGETARRLETVAAVETRDLDDFAAGEIPAVFEGLFGSASVGIARELAQAVFRRAANLTAAHLAAFLRRTALPASAAPVALTVDGSTFWKTRAIPFVDVVVEMLRATSGVPPFDILHVDEAPMVGAAVAACLRD